MLQARGQGPPRFWQIRRRRRAAAARRITTCPPRFLDFATCLLVVMHHIAFLFKMQAIERNGIYLKPSALEFLKQIEEFQTIPTEL